MSNQLLRFFAICTIGVAVATPSTAWAQTITTFDALGVRRAAFQGTVHEQNTQAGAITGYYVDANFVNYGFVRK